MSEMQGVFFTVAVVILAWFFGPPILIYSIQRFRLDMQILEFDPASISNSGIIEPRQKFTWKV